MQLDTGYLDSFGDFGINAAKGSRVHFRRKATCVPLNVSKYIETLDANGPIIRPLMEPTYGRAPFPAEIAWVLNYGQTRFYPGNITFVHFDIEANLTRTYTSTYVNIYYYSSPGTSQFSSFESVDELRTPNADLAIIFVATNRAISTSPIDGPIYSAHRITQFADDPLKTTYYLPDVPVGALGCTEQYEYCMVDKAGTRHCTQPRGATFDGFEELLPLASDVQIATLELPGQSSAAAGLVNAACSETAFLDSNTRFEGAVLDGLPSDQWKSDFEKLEGYVRAYLQIAVMTHSTGYNVETTGIDYPSTPSQKQLCRSQKVVKPAGFANIDVFGLVFTLFLAFSLVFVDFGILRLIILPGWIVDGISQLQCAAYEAYHDIVWQKRDREIPVLFYGETLKSLYYSTGDLD